ncbi:MAG: hypothetical protein IJZ19_03165 [Lentisphaeria bacterium]|nr:hypothetical protein [Lentisphaeria bacterium]
MKKGESKVCPQCGEKSFAKEKKVMENWSVKELRLVCSFCGADWGLPDADEKTAAVNKAADRFAALLGEVEKSEKADISPTEDYGKFCRNCKHFITHPFKSLCSRTNQEADPMGECEFFSAKINF